MAEELTQHLQQKGGKAFCTRTWCPSTGGSWADDTCIGATTCKVLIALVTDGWCKSKEVLAEMRIILGRWKRGEVKVILVRYRSELKQQDPENVLRTILPYFDGNQDVYHELCGTDKPNPDWMEQVATIALAKDNQNSTLHNDLGAAVGRSRTLSTNSATVKRNSLDGLYVPEASIAGDLMPSAIM